MKRVAQVGTDTSTRVTLLIVGGLLLGTPDGEAVDIDRAFLDRAPSFIAHQARTRQGAALKTALDATKVAQTEEQNYRDAVQMPSPDMAAN